MSEVDTKPYKESSLSRIVLTEGVGPKNQTISAAFWGLNNALPEDILLILGLQATDLKGPLGIGSLPLRKGRTHTAEYGQARSPQGPQCCHILCILECLQELRSPLIIRLSPYHRFHGSYLTMP